MKSGFEFKAFRYPSSGVSSDTEIALFEMVGLVIFARIRVCLRGVGLRFFPSVLRLGGLTLVVACLLPACTRLPVVPLKPEPTQVGVTLTASEQLNIDSRGRSTPVVVRVYVLKNATAFEAADFFSLFERDRQVLGDALMLREEVALKPGESRGLDAVELEGGKVVAVFAAFRDVDRAVWRASVPVVANRANRIAVSLQESRITLTTNLAFTAFPAVIATPSLPSAPSMPSMPSAPTLPSAPNLPSVPSVPSMPSMPSVPSMPSAPSVPSMPSSIWPIQ